MKILAISNDRKLPRLEKQMTLRLCNRLSSQSGCMKTTIRSVSILAAAMLAATIGLAEEASIAMPSVPLDTSMSVQRIAFGSCFKVERGGYQIWDEIRATEPDVLLLAGDNIYPESENEKPGLPELRAAYQELSTLESFKKVRRSVPVLSTWDDHDYGMNDGGADFVRRTDAEALFLEAWAVPEDDPRRQREGIYHSVTMGEEGRRLQLIMLDTRYFRSELRRTDKRGAKGKERYLPSVDQSKTQLGDDQWQWLEAQLQEPADLRLLVSSIQVIADGHGWEAWRMLPKERERLYDLLKANASAPTYVLSGDRHVAGFYEEDIGLDAPLLEFTSSPLNNTISFPWRRSTLGEAGPQRLGALYGESNFGTVDIDWELGRIMFSLRSREGEVIREESRNWRSET